MKSKPLLVVEDDGLIRMDIVDMLVDAGYQVLEAANADQALDVLEREPTICALLTDIDMPGTINGISLAHRVKEERPNCKIVVISGRYSPSQGTLPDEAIYLSKPISEGDLETTLFQLDIKP
ncbi:response regulator [Rhizobium sp. BIGb0125]|jgi:CheY-like chemotaxis protein|uniref:response regulator n=1 Tax=Rhizobium sp. BIGb0125 TaxID=2940618 RepID=UPI00216A0B5F|nr:response regulator [Rhizobium sp. BIGb0125]